MKALKTLIAIAAAATSMGAFAATDTANLHLGGTVNVDCTIAVEATAKASALDIVKGESEAHVATVTETCNAHNGYVVYVTSGNNGRLVNKEFNEQSVAFQAAYDDATGDISKELVADRKEARFGHGVKMTVSFEGNAQASAGYYADNLTFVIKAK